MSFLSNINLNYKYHWVIRRISVVRVLVTIEQKSYIAILASPKKIKIKTHTVVERNLIFLTSLLQCTCIYRCAL